MYKMLLVEDEPIVRLALKSLVDWNSYGFDEVLEASNGKKALEIMKDRGDIDIVITDINMPVMNGIELIEEGKKLGGNTEFLVLSAYDDYPLVRSAFKLGINDYILKTEMEPDKIVEMVMAALKKKKGSSNKRSTIDRNELIRKLIAGDLSKGELDDSILRLKGDYYLCCSILIDNFKIIKERYENNDLREFISSVVNAVYQVLETVNTGEVVSLSSEEYGIIFAFESSMESNINEKLEKILSKIRSALLNFLNIEVTIGISGVNKDIKKIKSLLEEGQRNARLRFIYGKGKNIYPKDEEEVNNTKKNKNNNITQQIIAEMTKENGILEALDSLDEEKCIEEMKKIFKMKKLFFTGNIESFYKYYLEIILAIAQHIIKDEGNNCEGIIGEDIDFYTEIRKFDTIAEIEEWIIKFLKTLISSLKKMNIRESKATRQAKDFIQKNYDAKITLDMVSKEVGFSKTYFSKIFAEETGENFTTYLTNVRIEKAKELLTKTEMKIYEVCEHTGYPNIEHFSRTFKKLVGVSPIQYKNKYIRR